MESRYKISLGPGTRVVVLLTTPPHPHLPSQVVTRYPSSCSPLSRFLHSGRWKHALTSQICYCAPSSAICPGLAIDNDGVKQSFHNDLPCTIHWSERLSMVQYCLGKVAHKPSPCSFSTTKYSSFRHDLQAIVPHPSRPDESPPHGVFSLASQMKKRGNYEGSALDAPTRLECLFLSPKLRTGKMFPPRNYKADITEVWRE